MQTTDRISDLIDRFERNLDQYKAGRYNEAQVRREFIDPFFKALGWDVDNTKGYAEAYKEVVHEDAIKVGRATKAPDYSFRVGGVRKFFLEAKKPSVYIKEEIHPAYQLRRYAWSAKLPVSILTDFEEFAVYDCRIKPVKTDKAAAARMMYLTFHEYAERWQELVNIFSPDAIMKGSFDKFVEAKKGKRGAAEVDDAFLGEIEQWRDSLARNLALRNPNLSQRDLNFAVQRTIDRIIFLRICEDRGIEHYETLRALQNGARVYPRLVEMFYRADERYNSGLFHFQQEKDRPQNSIDELTPELNVDDAVLKAMIKSLYYPDSPYEFSVLPADILGQVYERFLGKVIRLTAGHRAVVEEKPEVRKAGGVYYTPTYIVDYIVQQTVGKLVEGKKPGPRGGVSKLRILDPACGSGSFLLGAYQFLLDWHLDAYLQEKEKWASGRSPRIYKSDRGEWRLTTDERKRILLSNIYGVDIDPQAVEVTKLSLLLKVLEGEDEQSINRQLAFFHERVLPELSGNIKCGNSLIGPDFYDGQQLTMLDEDELYCINAFDWQREFAKIMSDGGFDAVIGNPPYGAVFSEVMQKHLKDKFSTFVWRGESYLLFVERAFQVLKRDGQFGYIIPDTYLNLGFTQSLRSFLLRNSFLREIVLLPSNVFEGATVDTTLLFAQKAEKNDEYNECLITVKVFNKKTNIESIIDPQREFEVGAAFWHDQQAFNVQSDEDELALIKKVEADSEQLSEIADLYYGIKVFQVGKGKPSQTPEIRDAKPFTSKTRKGEDWLPFYDGKNIGRYELLWEGDNWLNYGPWLAEPRTPEIFEGKKILIRKIVGQTLISTYVAETSYCNTLLSVLKIKKKEYSYTYLLGVLNSKLIGWYFRKKFQINPDDTFPQILIRDILQFPLPKKDKARHDQLVTLVERMLDLHKQKAAAQTGETRTLLERQIAATDQQIDRLVYELYELTQEEIEIVEESSKVASESEVGE